MPADLIGGLVAFLKADAGVAALAGGRVHGGHIPDRDIEAMPRATVVLKGAGGGLLGRAYLRAGDRRVDVDCYGRTDREGEDLYLAVHEALKGLRPTTVGNVQLKWAEPSSRGVNLRDPDTDWPLTASSWQVLAGEDEAT